MDYPKTLTPSDWDKKKGVIAKTHATGIGDALKNLERQHGGIDWAAYSPAVWLKSHPSAQAFEEVMDKRLQELQSKMTPLKQQSDKVESLARKWATTFAKDKLVPKSAAQAAQQVADAAESLSKGLKPWLDQLEKQATAVLAKLPSDEGDEPQDKLLSPDYLKMVLSRCRQNDSLQAQFAYCPPDKNDAAFVAHFKIPGKRLLAKVRAETGAGRGSSGTLHVKDGELLLNIDRASAGLVKQIRSITKTAGLRFTAIKVLDDKGQEIEQDQDQEDPLLAIKAELEALTSKVTAALKLDPTLKAPLLAAVSGVQDGVKRDDVTAAQLALAQLQGLVRSAKTPPGDAAPARPEEQKQSVGAQAACEARKKALATRIKTALANPFVANDIKQRFLEAETRLKAGKATEALQLLDDLETRLEEIEGLTSRYDAQAKAVLPLIEKALTQVSTKNQERLTKLRAFAQGKATSGDHGGALKALAELVKLLDAIRKESAPSTGGIGDDESAGAGEFLQGMEAESDWSKQATVLAEVRLKLDELKTWKEPEHDTLAKLLAEVDKAAAAGQHARALSIFGKLSPKTLFRHSQYPARGQWLALNAVPAQVQARIVQLTKLEAIEVASLRYDLAFAMSMGQQEKYAAGVKALNDVSTRTTDLLDLYSNNKDYKRWAAMNADLLKVSGQLEQAESTMKALSNSTPAYIVTMNQSLTQIRTDAWNQNYAQACSGLKALLPTVAKLHAVTTHLMRHRMAMDAVWPRQNAANAIDASEPLKKAALAYAAARQAVKDAYNVDDASKLDGLRAKLLTKMDELLKAYSALPDKTSQPSAARIDFMALRHDSVNPMIKAILAKSFKPITGEMETWLGEFNSALAAMKTHEGADEWTEASAQAQELVRLGRLLQVAAKKAGRGGAFFEKRWSPLTKRIAGLKKHINALPKPWSQESAAFMKALETMDTLRGASPIDFDACLAHLKNKLEPALNALMKQQQEQTQSEITNANNTDLAENLVKGKEPWELEALPPKQKADLLRNLRKAWGNPPSDDKRAAQRKIYDATRLDEDFVAYDEEQRAKIAGAFKGDKDMKKAQGGWGKTDWKTRLKLLERVAAEQCKAYDFGPPPVVKLVDLGGDASSVTNGYFDPNTKCIVINTNAYSSANDFERAVDLIIHENSHYFQDQLCSGMIDAESRDKRLLAQTELFKANNEAGAYVTSGEAPDAHATYQQQPLEEHAHLAGPEAAKAIVAALMA